MNKHKRKQNGITLISLVISIIVMLILAGVSLNAVIGDNGILNQAQDATIMQTCAALEEYFQSLYASIIIEEGENGESQIDTIMGQDIRIISSKQQKGIF